MSWRLCAGGLVGIWRREGRSGPRRLGVFFYDGLVHAVGPLVDSEGGFETAEAMRRRDRGVVRSVAAGRMYEGLGNAVWALGDCSGAFETLRCC